MIDKLAKETTQASGQETSLKKIITAKEEDLKTISDQSALIDIRKKEIQKLEQTQARSGENNYNQQRYAQAMCEFNYDLPFP